MDDEAQGVRVRGEVPGLDQAHDHRLLAIGVLGQAVVVVIGHVEVRERGTGAVHSRLAGHLLLVDAGRERLRRPGRLIADIAPVVLHQLTQRLAPGLLVGRVDEHAVDVKDRSLESFRHVCSSLAVELLLDGSVRLQLEGVTVAGAEVANLISDPDLDRAVDALGMGGERQPAVGERHQ